MDTEQSGEDRKSAEISRILPLEEFHRFINEKTLKKNCYECDANDWQVETLTPTAADAYDGAIPNSTLQHYVPVVAVSCKNCGNTKFFNREAVGRWNGAINA